MVGLFSSSRTKLSSSAVGMFGRVAPSCPRERTGVAGPGFILSAIAHLRVSAGAPDTCTYVLDQKDEVKRIPGQRLERGIEMAVELRGRRRLGVDQQRTDSDLGRHCGDLQEGIPNERTSQTVALLAQVNAEAGQDHNGYRIPARPCGEAL